MKRVPCFRQFDSIDCGPTCLRMIAAFYDKKYKRYNSIKPDPVYGTSMLGLKSEALRIGFDVRAFKINLEGLISQFNEPCIIHWNTNHFVVLTKIIGESDQKGGHRFYINDPSYGRRVIKEDEFREKWSNLNDKESGIVLSLKVSKQGLLKIDTGETELGFIYFISYLKKYIKPIILFISAILLCSLIAIILPFLTQITVDQGIISEDVNIIILILIAQLLLTLGHAASDMLRSWLNLHITTRISLSFISNFLYKLTRLPISFFDAKKMGDLLQRISDNSRIQNFITNTVINIIISSILFIVYVVIMYRYSLCILSIFIIMSLLYLVWITLFLRKRRRLDKSRFGAEASSQSNLIQFISGMQDIKLNCSENVQLHKWQQIQSKLYEVDVNCLALEQTQQIGGVFINQIKNILISYCAAMLVVKGQMTLGMMMAMQYIIGQLNAPIQQLMGFIRSTQDAKLSLERINDIYSQKDEDGEIIKTKIDAPDNGDITFKNISFRYDTFSDNYVLKDLSFVINKGKVTALVGSSGSGKTTILKLLLSFYKLNNGEIQLAGQPLDEYDSISFRSKCGIVMQESFIFNDSILNNIAMSDENPDLNKVREAVSLSELTEFIDSLPFKYETMIGREGKGLSSGQKQRILLARAIYKNPSYLFLDEATNSLDATTEKSILGNLAPFYSGRTVLIIAHRLSTIRMADNILVLDKGKIAEQGNHDDLINFKGLYYNLLKDQLS